MSEEINEDNLEISNEKPININKIKINKFNVEKPKEANMKFKEYKSKSNLLDESSINDCNISAISKIIIGEIEAYKDIIEKDNINNNNLFFQKSKSTLNLKNNFINSNKNFNDNNCINNIESIQILDDDLEQISDLLYDDKNNSNNNVDSEEYITNFNNNENDYIQTEEDILNQINNDNKEKHLIPNNISKIKFSNRNNNNNVILINKELSNHVSNKTSKKTLELEEIYEVNNATNNIKNNKKDSNINKENLNVNNSNNKDCIIF